MCSGTMRWMGPSPDRCATADPFGIDIAAVYAIGSRGASHENASLAVPSLQRIGLSIQDIERFGVRDAPLLPLTRGMSSDT